MNVIIYIVGVVVSYVIGRWVFRDATESNYDWGHVAINALLSVVGSWVLACVYAIMVVVILCRNVKPPKWL